MSGAQTEGLRARKKRAAREAIAATARRLFAERGFDAVTVAEIAAAADVSEKTVFNHFPTKEDLAFAGREEGIAQLVADITERPPGTSVLDVFRALTTTVLDDFVARGDEDLLTVAKIIRAQPHAAGAPDRGVGVGGRGRSPPRSPRRPARPTTTSCPRIVARTLWCTHRSIFLVALHGLVDGEDREQLVARLRVAADRAYDQLAGGLGEYGKGG